MFSLMKIVFWPVKEAGKFLLILFFLGKFTVLGNYVQIRLPDIDWSRLTRSSITHVAILYRGGFRVIQTALAASHHPHNSAGLPTESLTTGAGDHEKPSKQ